MPTNHLNSTIAKETYVSAITTVVWFEFGRFHDLSRRSLDSWGRKSIPKMKFFALVLIVGFLFGITFATGIQNP